MKTATFFKKLNPILILGSITFLIGSCGTYNVKNYDESDGIYSSNKTAVVENGVIENEDKNNYYKQYFQTKSLDYQNLPENNTILTDVEAYHSKDSLDAEGYVITENRDYISEFDEEYGSWGTNSTQVSINVYGGYNYAPNYGGWNIGFGWGWGYPYYWGGYNPYYGYGWGYPYPYPHYGYGGYYGYGHPGHGGYYGYASNRGRSNYGYTMARTYNRGRSNNYYSSSRGTNYNRRGNYRTQNNNYSRTQSSRRSQSKIGNVRPSTKPSYQGNSNNRNYSKRNYKPSKPSSKPSTTNRTRPSSKPSSSYRGGSTRSGSYGGGSRGGGSRGGSGRRGGL